MEPSRKDWLTQRAIRFYDRYGDEIDHLRQLLEVRLNQLALAYTLENKIPRESVKIETRLKTLESFLKKLSRKDWPEFYYPTEVARDLIGSRVICWFLDDCFGMLKYIKESTQFEIEQESIEDYITHPKSSGYRSIHLHTYLAYDRVTKVEGKRQLVTDKFIAEIQLRTKIQDAWAELTHEVHYKEREEIGEEYNTLLSEIATVLASQDRSALVIRNILQRTYPHEKREGFRSKT